MSSALTILFALGYASALFGIAFWVDRRGLGRLAPSAYALSLARAGGASSVADLIPARHGRGQEPRL